MNKFGEQLVNYHLMGFDMSTIISNPMVLKITKPMSKISIAPKQYKMIHTVLIKSTPTDIILKNFNLSFLVV